MPEVATLERATEGEDGRGGWTRGAWAVVAAEVPMSLGAPRVAPQAAIQALLAGREGWVATVPHGTGLQDDDRLVLAGARYRVVAVEPLETYDTAERAWVVPEP